MPQPQSLADFSSSALTTAAVAGPGVSGATCTSGASRRFAAVSALSVDLPEVKVGNVYRDMDPRQQGRRVQVLGLGRDARVLVRVLQPSFSPPKTPSVQRRDTTDDTHWINQARFREGSRGFAFLYRASVRSVEAFLLTCHFVALVGRPASEAERRACDALVALLGHGEAVRYFAEWRDLGSLGEFLAEEGVEGLLGNALRWRWGAEGGKTGLRVQPRGLTRSKALHALAQVRQVNRG